MADGTRWKWNFPSVRLARDPNSLRLPSSFLARGQQMLDTWKWKAGFSFGCPDRRGKKSGIVESLLSSPSPRDFLLRWREQIYGSGLAWAEKWSRRLGLNPRNNDENSTDNQPATNTHADDVRLVETRSSSGCLLASDNHWFIRSSKSNPPPRGSRGQ